MTADMPFIVDASITACWLLPDEAHVIASRAEQRLLDDVALVPRIWWFEMRNILIVNERRGRLSSEQSDRALHILSRLPIEIVDDIDEVRLLTIARRHRLTAYDAAYLELAGRESVALATLDVRLAAAAQSEGVALI